jgi:hypothetical protein
MKLIKVHKLELFGLQCYIGTSCERREAPLIPLKDVRIVPGPARPIHLYFLVDPSPGRGRGQPPGIARVDGRARDISGFPGSPLFDQAKKIGLAVRRLAQRSLHSCIECVEKP